MRFVAFGGQGIVLAGVIMGEAAIADGMNAVQTQSYGPESRGGAAKSEVIISGDEIDYPAVVEADKALFRGQYREIVDTVFGRRGFLSGN